MLLLLSSSLYFSSSFETFVGLCCLDNCQPGKLWCDIVLYKHKMFDQHMTMGKLSPIAKLETKELP